MGDHGGSLGVGEVQEARNFLHSCYVRYLNLANSGKIYNYKLQIRVYRSDLEVQELEYSIQAFSFAETKHQTNFLAKS